MSDTDLGELMGALVAGVTKARGMSDASTAEMAQIYRNHETLSGLSLPRFRIKSIDFDVPFVVTGVDRGEAFEAKPAEYIVANTLDLVEKEYKEHGLEMDPRTREIFAKTLTANVESAVKNSTADLSDSRNTAIFQQKIAESARNALNTSLAEARKRNAEEAAASSPRAEFLRTESIRAASFVPPQAESPELLRKLSGTVADKAGELAVARQGSKGRILASVLTQDIKERGTPDTVSRIKMTLSEEGLEWSHDQDETTGVVRSKLTPE